ncbi:MAG: hypothetical protein IJA30_02600 [Bacilli bacterium]|nr:hypothetical protein [Bacilli bacterium]
MKVVNIQNLTEMVKENFGRDIKVYFIRINPYPMNETLKTIYDSIADLSWTKIYDTQALKKGGLSRVNKTIRNIEDKLKRCENDSLTSEVGEYVISILGKQALLDNLNYIDIPLAELWKAKVKGNPGFDFYCESIDDKLIFGEAKYESGKNAYNEALEQINDFITEGKDYEDLVEVKMFVSQKASDNMDNENRGFAAAFSSTSIENTKLVNHIIHNKHFNELLSYDELLLVAVDINE